MHDLAFYKGGAYFMKEGVGRVLRGLFYEGAYFTKERVYGVLRSLFYEGESLWGPKEPIL